MLESKIVKAGLNDFFEKDEYIWCEVEDYEIEMFNERPFHIQICDIVGEAIRLSRSYEKWKTSGKGEHAGGVIYLNLIHKLCFLAHSNPNFTDEEKSILRAAQWEQYDFYLWGNKCNNTSESVMNWFNNYMENIYPMMARGELGNE